MIIGIDKGSRSRKYVIAAQNMGVSHKMVDCSSSDIIRQLEGVDALIWHWTHDSYIDKNVAFHIIKSAEMMGKRFIRMRLHAGCLTIRFQRNICWRR